jgi:hypothetical protein
VLVMSLLFILPTHVRVLYSQLITRAFAGIHSTSIAHK